MKKVYVLLLIAITTLSFKIFNSTAHDLSVSNFSQNWSNAALIAANDDWSGVTSIQGFRGDGLAGATAVDPQTILVADDPGVIDVNANQTAPNTFTTGGVTEFAIADPVIAFQGSGTARAPYIKIYLNTTNRATINVQYNLRDIDGSTDNSVQPVALHYRVGSSGTFTNIPTAFVADASTGPSLATLVTSVNVTLPAACDNQPVVELRIMTTDAVGADEWIGVDDISITSLPNIPSPTTTSISPNTATAGDPGFTLTVNGTNFINGSSTVTWNGANRTTTFVNNTQLTATIPAGDIASAGVATVGVTTTGAPASSNTQSFTINGAGTPVLNTTTPLTAFGNICINTTAGPNSFILDGNNLTSGGSISLAALAGFSYSENSGGPFTSTLNFTYTGTSFTGKQIYVQFNPTLVQSYDGNIVLSGGGVASFPVAASGSGVNTAAAITTGASSNVGATTATASGTINDLGCGGSLVAYGIEYSINTGFPNGSGTQVASTNLSGGIFSSNITGLAPNTRYFYKAYVTTTAGTTWGLEQSFTNTPLPVLMSAQSGLSYTEDFSDIANWTDFFISGVGANHFDGLSTNATGTIPDGVRITTSTNTFQGSLTSGGVQKGTIQSPSTTSIVLLSTGSPDNTSSAAIDFYLDFTGLNAGTLSFDWASLNNQTGDRAGSLRVYTSTDGITFTELTFASVLNFTNGNPTSDSKSNIQLPASFNNSATARLRFYYHNGSGGSTGSRPKISIDNLTITALATTPCVSPTAPATALNFGTITDVSIQGSFTTASPAVDEYLVVMSTSNVLTNNPVDGQNYSIGDNVGDGTVIAKGSATSFTATGLNPLTTYYFFVFPMNSICTGGPLYYTATVLNGSASTVAGLPPCSAPASQPTSLVFGTVGVNSIQGSFTATTADGYLVLISTSSSLSNTPVNGNAYNTGDVLGNATVVQRSSATTFTASGLTTNTTYYVYIFSLNSAGCVNGPAYNTISPLTGSQLTNPLPPCSTPGSQPGGLTFTKSNNAISGAFTPVAGVDDYLVVMSTSSTLSGTPVDNTDYVASNSLGGGTVVSNSLANRFLASNLNPGTTYYFFIFSANRNCSGGTKYLATSPLTGNTATTAAPANNYYFGTLHSHSDYSDGNQDNPGFTPADDYAYAMNSQCMDFLGISEHNHFSSVNNPGNQIANYHLGSAQANAFTTANPNFLALYGMEWGVISGGGHVLIYGNGMDNLWGWESGSGVWGSSNNYDVFVPKSDYIGANGLFKTVNDNIATNTFASLAHPNSTDYGNIAGIAYNAMADSAIAATAVENGPSTSSNTTYSNPASSMGYLSYYQRLLAKGYHLGPTIDHDNHRTTFGRTTYSRTAIVSPALTKSAIIGSIRNMNFYATQDCDTRVDFTVNTMPMGSIFKDRYAPIISVNLTDATSNLTTAVIRVMYGVPGSGTFAVKIDSAIGSNLTFIDNNLANLTTGYYYLDISIGAARIVTSPVWYTRDDANAVLPVTLTSFTAQKMNNSSLLKWTTSQEHNSQEFRVERSTNGTNWQTIATVAAAGSSNTNINYSIVDVTPAKGSNLYRLKQIDIDGRSEYSAIRKVNFDELFTFSIYPNPAKDRLHITVDNAAGVTATVQVLNAQSQVLINEKLNTTTQPASLNVAALKPGMYFLKIIGTDGAVTVQKFVKE